MKKKKNIYIYIYIVKEMRAIASCIAPNLNLRTAKNFFFLRSQATFN